MSQTADEPRAHAKEVYIYAPLALSHTKPRAGEAGDTCVLQYSTHMALDLREYSSYSGCIRVINSHSLDSAEYNLYICSASEGREQAVAALVLHKSRGRRRDAAPTDVFSIPLFSRGAAVQEPRVCERERECVSRERTAGRSDLGHWAEKLIGRDCCCCCCCGAREECVYIYLSAGPSRLAIWVWVYEVYYIHFVARWVLL